MIFGPNCIYTNQYFPYINETIEYKNRLAKWQQPKRKKNHRINVNMFLFDFVKNNANKCCFSVWSFTVRGNDVRNIVILTTSIWIERDSLERNNKFLSNQYTEINRELSGYYIEIGSNLCVCVFVVVIVPFN